MKKIMNKLFVCLTIMALTVLTGCTDTGFFSKSDEKVEVVDSAFLVDRESGEYSIVVIVENKTGNPIKEGFCSETAFDKDGKQMPGQAMHVAAPFAWLCEGERQAYMYTTADVPGESILDHYETLPDTLEWEVVQATENQELTPLGISVAECIISDDYGDWAEYEITLKNESDTDYGYDMESMYYQSEVADFDLRVVAVFRDDEGTIKDAVLMTPRPVSQKALPANSEESMVFYSNHVCTDETLTPEYYLSIERYEFH